MFIDLHRINDVIDGPRLAASQVALVGCGASHHLATSLARSGIGRFVLFDSDRVRPENLCRTDFAPCDVGFFKVDALGRTLETLGKRVECVAEPFGESHWSLLRDTSLIIAATDSLEGQAAVNRFAVQCRVPAVFVGLAERGLGGEIVFWRPGLPCYRCLVGKRYEPATQSKRESDPSSQAITLFDVGWADAIAGQLALGLLMQGTPKRFATLIDELADRNYLRLKNDPSYRLAAKDVVRQELGIPEDNEHFMGWCVSVQSDPARGQPPCADCVAAGHRVSDESCASFFSVPCLPPGRDKTWAEQSRLSRKAADVG